MNHTFVFNKERSIKACMSDAWKIIALNWKTYLKALWPYVLFAGLTYAFYLEIHLQYIREQAIPALLLHDSGGDAEVVKMLATPTLSNLAFCIISFVLLVFGYLCATSRLFKIISYTKSSNTLPTCLPYGLDREDFHTVVRIFTSFLTMIAGFMLISAPFAFVALKWSLWALVAIPLIAVYFASFGILCTMRHALFNDALAPSIRYSLKHAFGQLFIIMLLTSIPIGICTLITTLPQATYVCSVIAFTKSQLMSDAAYLPWGLTVVSFIVNALCAATSLLITSYLAWVISLKTYK